VELTAEDLSTNPVWRYEGGSGKDARVAAVKRDSLSRADDEIYLAATEFELFDETACPGYCFPADGAGIDYLQPVILTASGPVAFWFEQPPSAETLAQQWKALGKDPAQVFPVTFRCLVPVDGQTLHGRIEHVEYSEVAPPAPAPEPPKTEEPKGDAFHYFFGQASQRTHVRRAGRATSGMGRSGSGLGHRGRHRSQRL